MKEPVAGLRRLSVVRCLKTHNTQKEVCVEGPIDSQCAAPVSHDEWMCDGLAAFQEQYLDTVLQTFRDQGGGMLFGYPCTDVTNREYKVLWFTNCAEYYVSHYFFDASGGNLAAIYRKSDTDQSCDASTTAWF